MMTVSRRAAWLLLPILLVPVLAWARVGRLVGKVVDPAGQPIAGVTVTTTSPDIAGFEDVTTTDRKGIFKVDFERVRVLYRYRLEKAGYVTLVIEQKWTLEGTDRQTFTMQPGEMAVPGAPPPASTSNEAIQAFNGGASAVRAKDYATAATKFEEALGYDPRLRQAWEALSLVALRQKDYQKAAEAAEKAIALGSSSEEVLRSRWEAYRHLGDEARIEAARADLERVGRLGEEAKRIYNEGVALSRAGDAEGALAKYQEALDTDPNLQVARLAFAVAALDAGRAAEAAAAAQTVLEADPGNEEALQIRYNASLKLGDATKVVDALVGLAAVDRDVALDGLFKLATAAYDSDETAKAKERFSKVLEIDPDYARAHYFLGLILMRENARKESQRHLERFLDLAPNDPEAATARKVLEYLNKGR